MYGWRWILYCIFVPQSSSQIPTLPYPVWDVHREDRTGALGGVFHPWLIQATHKDAYRTTHPRLQHTLWHYANVCVRCRCISSTARYGNTVLQTNTKHGCKYCVLSDARIWNPVKWLTTIWGIKYTSPNAPWGIFFHLSQTCTYKSSQTHPHTGLFVNSHWFLSMECRFSQNKWINT